MECTVLDLCFWSCPGCSAVMLVDSELCLETVEVGACEVEERTIEAL